MQTRPTRFSPTRRGAFTLLELLVVITIIGVLAGLAFGSFSAVMKQARKTQAKNTANNLVIAINSYFNEYGKYPIQRQGRDREMMTDRELMAPLTDPDNKLNPRGIVFYEDKPAKKQGQDFKSGIVFDGDKVDRLVDPFGEEYVVWIDGNYDKKVRNPDTDSDQETLAGGVFVYSKGADRDERQQGTAARVSPWKDNVATWK